MRSFLLLALVGCGSVPGELAIHLPSQLAASAQGIRLSVFEDQACDQLSMPLGSEQQPLLQEEFSRGALSDTTGRSATLSLSPVPAGDNITLTAEIFGDAGVLQFKGCQDGIEVLAQGQHPISLEITRP